MATTDSQSESAIEASLEPNQRQAFRELIDDYNVAEGLHLQSWRGGINPSVAAALVRRGRRRPPN
jgi:type IV pilus biogenesis protein CpaD/CtpE